MHGFHHFPIILLVVGGLMAFRFWRMSQRNGPRGLRLEQLWVAPALMGALMLLVLTRMHLHGRAWIVLLLAWGVGAAFGWWRGGMIEVAVDPRTNRLTQQASPLVLYVVLGLFAMRLGLRFGMAEMGGRRWVMMGSAGLVAFVFAMMAAQRLEIYLRARRLLAGGAVRSPFIPPRRR